MSEWLAYAGPRLRLEYAVRRDGSCPAQQFFDSLDIKDQAKLMALFVRMGNEGRIASREQFKKVEGTEYFEFKRFQIRVLCRFQPGRRVLLIHGFWKKQERIPRREIEKADRIFAEHAGRGQW